MRRACQEFHNANKEVWELFVKFALEKAALGYEHFGAKAVMERIRWETSVGGSEPELKINGNHTAFYARRFNRMYPQLGNGEFFRVREQTSRQRGATARPEFRDARQ
jgi:hypothetical protein